MSTPNKKSLGKKLKEEGEDEEKAEKDSEYQKEEFGESLSTCSDVEWNRADPAYAPELINVKKKPDKVTVFAGPSSKTIERTIIRTDTFPQSIDENADAIGRLASAITHIFLSDKAVPSVNVSIDLQESPNESQSSIESRRS